MSHFTVLVIGDDVDKLLAPFHEFECTGFDNGFVQLIDELDEARAEYARQIEKSGEAQPFVKWCTEWYGRKVIKAGNEPNLKSTHKYGWMRVNEDGTDVIELIRRTNPNARWDWYRIGGRWSGMLKHKDGQDIDQARKRDIDFALMRDIDAAEAGRTWDAIHGITRGRTIEPWAQVQAKFCDPENSGDIEKARDFYHAQSVVIDLKTASHENKIPFLMDYEKWVNRSREICVTEAAETAGITHAVITKDGVWHERGEMGWFAHVRDEKAASEWESEFGTMIDELSDDDLLTVVDCHI